MSVAFYRKYRSKNLDQVVGQKHITDVLKLALEQNKISHAYLFTGPRGVGKTSIARILAHEINNLPYEEESTHPDIIEIDAASNNGVEDIRQLRDQIQSVPFSAEKRIYIIDEVHMLSKPAFNALLKTLEEPPTHAIFILATTDAHKLPATIISRTQQFVFRFISQEDICSHLKFIAENEKLNITDEALQIIAERGGGSFRDSISLLDQLSSSSQKITAQTLEQILGLAPKKQIEKIISAFNQQNSTEIFNTIEEIKLSGTDLKIFTDQLIQFIKNNLSSSPHLAKLLLPLSRAKNSDFLELELLVILLENFNQTQTIIQPIQKIEHSPNQPKKEIIEPQKTITKKITKSTKESKKITSKKEQSAQNSVQTETVQDNPPKEFNWLQLINHLDENENKALATLLKKTDFDTNGQVLTIYAGAKFNKNQLDKAQNRALISKSLSEIGAGNWQIETIASQKPPENSEASKVFDIMGGGEEVKIDEQF